MNSLTSSFGPGDAANLAVSVRELASSAHALLRDPAASVEDLLAIQRRITRLEARLRGVSANPLSQWVENLRRRVEAAACDRDDHRCATVTFRREPAVRTRRVAIGRNA